MHIPRFCMMLAYLSHISILVNNKKLVIKSLTREQIVQHTYAIYHITPLEIPTYISSLSIYFSVLSFHICSHLIIYILSGDNETNTTLTMLI